MFKELYKKSPVIFNAVVIALVTVANELLKKYVEGFPEIDAQWVLSILGVASVPVTYASVSPSVGKKDPEE